MGRLNPFFCGPGTLHPSTAKAKSVGRSRGLPVRADARKGLGPGDVLSLLFFLGLGGKDPPTPIGSILHLPTFAIKINQM